MKIIRLHYQRGGFGFLKKHSLARNLSSLWEGWDEVSDCHSSLCSWCMSQELAQRSTAEASTFFFVRGGFTDTVTSIIRSSKSIIASESFAAETESVGGFLSWCSSYTGSVVDWQCIVFIVFIARQHTAADARYWYSNSVRLSVCPWHAGIVWKRLNVSS